MLKLGRLSRPALLCRPPRVLFEAVDITTAAVRRHLEAYTPSVSGVSTGTSARDH